MHGGKHDCFDQPAQPLKGLDKDDEPWKDQGLPWPVLFETMVL